MKTETVWSSEAQTFLQLFQSLPLLSNSFKTLVINDQLLLVQSNTDTFIVKDSLDRKNKTICHYAGRLGDLSAEKWNVYHVFS